MAGTSRTLLGGSSSCRPLEPANGEVLQAEQTSANASQGWDASMFCRRT